MRKTLTAALAAVLGMAAAPAWAASTPIDCAASLLHVQHLGRCSAEESTTSRRVIYRNNGPVGGGGFSLNLYFAAQGQFVTEESTADTERFLQRFNETVKNESKNWSAFFYEDGIYYALFDYRGNRCAAFSKHGPPSGNGYQWLLAGYQCRVGSSDPFDDLKQMLRFTRVGSPNGALGARDAYGKAISAEASYAP